MAVINWFARRLPPCNVITHQLSQSLDRKLTLRERFVLRLHLLICVWCTRYGRQISYIKDRVREQAGVAKKESTPTHCLSPDARERIKQSLRSDSS
jgi:hypothetical protein